MYCGRDIAVIIQLFNSATNFFHYEIILIKKDPLTQKAEAEEKRQAAPTKI